MPHVSKHLDRRQAAERHQAVAAAGLAAPAGRHAAPGPEPPRRDIPSTGVQPTARNERAPEVQTAGLTWTASAAAGTLPFFGRAEGPSSRLKRRFGKWARLAW